MSDIDVMIDTESSPCEPVSQISRLRRLVALAGLMLIAATWKLWTPQTAFPQVPLFRWALYTPTWIDWLGLAGIVISLGTVLIVSSTNRLLRPALMTFVLVTALMVIINQHRLQAWAYQFALLAVILAFASPGRAKKLARILVISIYFYSALSKFDMSFIETQGQFLLEGLIKPFGWKLGAFSETHRKMFAAALPTGEFLVAGGLYFRATRPFAVVASILMHLALLVALGPFGHDHERGVLIWNLYFIAQNIVLFGPLRKGFRDSVSDSSPLPDSNSQVPESIPSPAANNQPESRWFGGRLGNRAATAFVAIVVFLPFLEPWGYFDHWPAWALYASRQERVRVYLSRARNRPWPKFLQPHTKHVWDTSYRGKDGLVQLDRWSLEALRAPVSPQSRFQLGVAIAIARECDRDLWVEIDGSADRYDAFRISWEFHGITEIEREADRFWLNIEPRPIFDP